MIFIKDVMITVNVQKVVLTMDCVYIYITKRKDMLILHIH